MKEKNKKRQIAKITVFMTSIFVILVSVTYAFITQVVSGTKQVVVSAGVLDLVLEEENAIIIENALPMYDEVGMIQDPFTFRLVNNGSNSANYEIKLVDVTPQTVERKCSDLGEITLDSPVECREVSYPDELRFNALELCKNSFNPNITTESECLTTINNMGAPYTTFEEFVDFAIDRGMLEDARTVGVTYPDKIIKMAAGELYFEDVRYGLTKNGEDTIGYLDDLEWVFNLNNPEIREMGLKLCKDRFPGVTDEISCLEEIGWYETFEDFILDNIEFNGGLSLTLDLGTISAKETINYDLRLWISEYIEDISWIEGMVFSFKIDVEVSQEIAEVPGKPMIDKLFASDSLGENCKTYDDGVDTFLVGQCSRNYVWYSGKLWRVVLKNNETGNMKMVTDNAITTMSYNGTPTQTTYEKGNSTFNNSYADQWLNQEFLPTLHDVEDYLITDYRWNATTISYNVPTRPAETTMVVRTVGLLNGYEYYTTYAQSDDLATSSTGYLNAGIYWYSITPSTTQNLRVVYSNGSYNTDPSTVRYGIRPAVNLKAEIEYVGGNGSISNPYILKGDSINSSAGSTLLSTRYSGEYVTFNNELYRIVAVEDGLTKITAVNVHIPEDGTNVDMNVFDKTSPLSSNFAEANIKIELEDYYQGLDNTWKKMVQPNTTWYLKTYGDYQGGSNNYKVTICENVDVNISTLTCNKTTYSTTASIGLPRVGEMFTSIITRGEKEGYWTLSPYSKQESNPTALYVSHKGNLHQLGVYGGGYGIRPALYLKQNVVIASDNTGNGTYEKPYKIELGA